MLTHYLDSVRFKNYYGLVGAIYYIPTPQGGWRFISTNVEGRTYKVRIFNDMRKHDQPENIAEWEWQPVVERSHLESLDFNSSLSLSFENEFPVVLVRGKDEYSMYSRLFRTSSARELFGSDYASDNSRRLPAKEEALANPNWRKTFTERAFKLAQMYDYAYAGDPVLQQVAKNVFLEVKRRIMNGALGTR